MRWPVLTSTRRGSTRRCASSTSTPPGSGSTSCRLVFFLQAEDGIRAATVTGVQTCALPISDDRYGRSLRVKTNVAEVLRAEVSRRGWKREAVAIGAATDPYQPAEGRYRLTRSCLEVLGRAATPFSIVTRGPMIVRDFDVLQEAAARAAVQVNFSVPTLDMEVWRRTEPGTAPPRQRLRALKVLVDAG